MARADLLIELVKHAVRGNKPMIKKVTEAIIAEERGKQHIVLAERLQKEINNNSNELESNISYTGGNRYQDYRVENIVSEIIPQKQLAQALRKSESTLRSILLRAKEKVRKEWE